MRAHTISLATSIILAMVVFLPSKALAQADTARPAILESASQPIGKVVAVTGSVRIEHKDAVLVQASASGQTKIGDLVYLGDLVVTGADGKVGINFTDGSSFNLLSNAQMAMDQYVYDPKGSSNSTLFSLSKGTFTFVAGQVAKTGDMKVDTPVATMGIRGTTPHVEIGEDGSTKFSTLIEEGKSKVMKKAATSKTQPADRTVDDKPNLNICRHC